MARRRTSYRLEATGQHRLEGASALSRRAAAMHRCLLIAGSGSTVANKERAISALRHEHRRSTRRCATVLEMKEGPSGSAIRSLIPSHRELLRSKAVVVSVAETPGRDLGRHG